MKDLPMMMLLVGIPCSVQVYDAGICHTNLHCWLKLCIKLLPCSLSLEEKVQCLEFSCFYHQSLTPSNALQLSSFPWHTASFSTRKKPSVCYQRAFVLVEGEKIKCRVILLWNAIRGKLPNIIFVELYLLIKSRKT